MTNAVEPPNSSPLAPYRILDLTEGGFNWCGKVLADLGADVIKVEPPEGSLTRRRGPFVDGVEDPEGSLFWAAYCLNKRSAVLDIERADGAEALRELARGADVLVESFAPGYLAERGLGFDDLAAANPGLVYTSITPYGQTGPRAHHRAADIAGWAMGGMQYLCGDEDRTPVRVAVPQAELHAGAQAAAGTMIALRARNRSGAGRHVDVNMQASVIWTMHNVAPYPKLAGGSLERGGAVRRVGKALNRVVFSCKDGFLRPYAYGGWVSGDSMTKLTRWMDEEGAAPEFMKRTDWPTQDMNRLEGLQEDSAEVQEFYAMQEALQRFFAGKTKVEILERAVSEKLLIAPCQTPRDLRENAQLAARGFWVDVPYPNGRTVTHPGPYIKLSETPLSYRRAAPRLGEHTAELLGEAHKPAPLPESPLSGQPFEGLRVLDMSWVGVGPMTMKFLADHGATVIRVESESRADPSRSVGPFKDGKPGLNRGQFSANFNTGKYGLGLNLKTEEARALIRRIVREWRPDVMAESFTPGTMARWGLDYASMRALHPDIVYFSTTLLGQTGPHRTYGGYGGTAAAMSGFHNMAGWPDRMPAEVYGAYTDFINPPNAVAAVIAALDHRDRTGQGQHVDLAQAECAAHYLAPALLDYTVNGVVQARAGNRDSFAAPHGAYPCAPRPTAPGGSFIAIAVTSDDEWAELGRVLGGPPWAEEARFADRAGRLRLADELDALIGEATKERDAYALMEALQDAGVAAGVVQSAEELWRDPQLEHWGFFHWLDHNECGPMPYNGPQFKLSGESNRPRWAAPTVGQHNVQVLREILGLDEDDVADLFAAGALESSF